ncbi:MAG: hypothetical protein GTO33_06215, partial [Acidobacteria bacterium]|nr:hypothetical protein [Acidobacteriota bacterium]
MAIIGINLNPTPRELKWFGAIVLVFFALIGGLIFWRVPSPVGALVVWSVGLALALV